ncbi:MAG: hypothetical protein QOK27_213, partial [Gemmatimonadales bacterium]|nr:hypothetical protein [Gemmatimonadales bacterium]
FPASPLPRLPALLADLVVVIHFSFVLFVILGGLLVLRRPRLAYVHLPAAAWGVLIELTGWVCPLTPLEQSLRLKAGEQGYSGSFIEHYLLPLLYPSALTRNIQLLLGCLVLGLNLGIYGYLLYRRAENSTSVTRPRSGDSRS